MEGGNQTLLLGATQNTLLSAKLTDLGDGRLRAEPHLNDAGQQTFAPGEPFPPLAAHRFKPNDGLDRRASSIIG